MMLLSPEVATMLTSKRKASIVLRLDEVDPYNFDL